MAEKGVRIRIVSESVGKGFKDANKALAGLQSSFKKLAGAAGIGLSTAALINFGKESVKAFAENEKSAKRLAGVVKNLGLAFETPVIEASLDRISAKYGYQGEVLRQAYQKLITATGSLEKSQLLLQLSLDVAAGSGEDLLTVNQDLANLYIGNTKGLKKYNLGLSQAQLKTLKFEDAVALLSKTFKNASADELNTFSGQMRVLEEAAGNAQEIIGGGLIDALMILSGDTTVEELASTMADLATNTAAALTNLGKFGRGVVDTFGPIATGLEKFILATDPFVDLIVEGDPSGFMTKPKATARRFFTGGQDSVQEARNNAERKRAAAEEERKRKAREWADNKAARDRAKLEKESLKQKKLSKIFDLEYIQIYAALQGKLSEEDRTRLRLQLAILDENVTAAEYLAKKLGEAQGQTSMLATFLRTMPDAKNPFSKWGEYLAALELEAKRIAALEFNAGDAGSKKTNVDQGGGTGQGGGGTDQGGAGGGGGGASVVAPKTYLDYLGMGQFEVRANPYQGDVTVIVNGSVLTNQELTEAIRQGLLNASLSGSSSTTNRINGNFASL